MMGSLWSALQQSTSRLNGDYAHAVRCSPYFGDEQQIKMVASPRFEPSIGIPVSGAHVVGSYGYNVGRFGWAKRTASVIGSRLAINGMLHVAQHVVLLRQIKLAALALS